MEPGQHLALLALRLPLLHQQFKQQVQQPALFLHEVVDPAEWRTRS
jgi:hypothetical protein